MKYVILIHANPDPWGHPTSHHTAEGRALPAELHEAMDRRFDALLEELSASGEFVTAEALADPASATVYGWSPGRSPGHRRPVCGGQGAAGRVLHHRLRLRERAEQIAAQFAQPGGSVELRPLMWPGADDH